MWDNPELSFKSAKIRGRTASGRRFVSHGAYKVTVAVIIFVEAFIPCRRAFIISYEIFVPDSAEVSQSHRGKERGTEKQVLVR